MCGTTKPILRLYKSHRLSARLFSWTDCNVSSTPCGNKGQVMKPPPIITTHLSITARHSFLQVKRLPRRSRKVPGAVVMGGGVCLHSISSIGNGAGRMFRVAPGGGRITGRLQMKAQPSHGLQVHFWIGSINCTSKKSKNYIIIMRAVTFSQMKLNSQKNHPFMKMYVRMPFADHTIHSDYKLNRIVLQLKT